MASKDRINLHVVGFWDSGLRNHLGDHGWHISYSRLSLNDNFYFNHKGNMSDVLLNTLYWSFWSMSAFFIICRRGSIQTGFCINRHFPSHMEPIIQRLCWLCIRMGYVLLSTLQISSMLIGTTRAKVYGCKIFHWKSLMMKQKNVLLKMTWLVISPHLRYFCVIMNPSLSLI